MDEFASRVLDGLEQLDVGIGVFDEEARLVHCNSRFRELRRYPDALCRTGVRLEDLIRHNAERGDFGPGDVDAQVAERMAEIAGAGAREVEREMADGQVLRIRYRRTASGGQVISFTDCTAERRAEAALKASEERYALIADAAEEAVYEWDIVSDRFYASPRLRAMVPRDLGEEGERSWHWEEIVHPDDRAGFAEALEAHISGERLLWNHEYRIEDGEGGWRWVRDHGTSIRGEDGRALRMVAALRDVTGRVERDAALAISEKRHAMVTEATADGIYDWEVDSKTLWVSGRVTRDMGFDPEVEGSDGWYDRLHPDDKPGYLAKVVAHLRGESDTLDAEYRAQVHGEYRWMHDRGVGQRGPDGRVVRVVGAIRDIDELKRAQAELDRTQGLLLSSLATISDGILLVDGENRVQLWNDRYYEIFSEAAGGADLSDLIVKGRRFEDMIRDGYDLGMFKPHPEGVDAWIAARMKAWMQPASQWELELANGVWILLNERMMPDGGRVSVYTDITGLKRREEEARASRQRFEDAIESLSTGFALFDAEDRLVMWNARFQEYFAQMADVFVPGATFRTIIAASIERGMFPAAADDPDRFLEDLLEKRRNGIGQIRENQLDSGLWLQITDHRTKEGGLVSIYTDVTELKTSAQAAQAARDRFEEAIEAVASGFALWDAEDRLVICNSRYRDYFVGLEEKVAPGVTFSDLITEAILQGLFPNAEGDPEKYLVPTLEKRAEASGAPREQLLSTGIWLQITDHRTRDGGLVSIYTDVTELRQREAQLRAALDEFDAVLENIDYGVVFMGADLRARLVNRAMARMWNFTQAFIDTRPSFREMIEYNRDTGLYDVAPEDWESYIDARVAELEQGNMPAVELHRADGKVLSYRCIDLPDGGRMLTYFDITELKDRQAAQEKALAEFNALLENIDYGILFYDRDLRAKIGNRAYREMWEQPPELLDTNPHFRELAEYNRPKGFYDVPDEDWDDWLESRVAEIEAGGFPPRELHRSDGMIMSYQGVVLPDGGRMLTYFDITELKNAEQVLRDSEARLRGILENSPIGVAVIRNDDNVILFHNPRFAEILRGPGQDLVGVVSSRFWTDHAEREKARQVFEKEGRIVNREVRYKALDGSEIWSLSTYERAQWEGESARLIWLFDITEEKANREALVVARDAAERALADLQKAQARLVQAEKMASLGQLTAGIAHEIKNPLNFVNNFARLSDELLEELAEILEAPIKALDAETRDDAEDLLATVRENLGKINQHGKRADSIVKNMLLHSREGPSERQRVALNPIVEEALNLSYHGARAENPRFNIEMKTALDDAAGEIECFPQDIMRVFLNLVTNGMYAANKRLSESGGAAPEIAVTTRVLGDRVEVEVRDNGTGIPPELVEKIFNPFFTTKPAGEGTGLGLSLSYDIVVKQHGGDLSVDSTPGEFTAFRVSLPRTLPADGEDRR